MPESAAERVAQVPLWYHTIEISPGVVTPGWFDLRPVVDQMPWPAVEGKRCLDVGTADGFLAFELERRGASEVVAIDLRDHGDWDFSSAARGSATTYLNVTAGDQKGVGFRTAHELIGSSVRYEQLSVYDLAPERLGHFDVVVCGSLLLHLKDPMRALEAMRSVCTGELMSSEQIDPILTLLSFRRPAAWARAGELTQWWVPNVRAHRALVTAAGFDVVQATRPYAIAFGASHPRPPRGLGALGTRTATRAVTRAAGVPHVAVLAHPR